MSDTDKPSMEPSAAPGETAAPAATSPAQPPVPPPPAAEPPKDRGKGGPPPRGKKPFRPEGGRVRRVLEPVPSLEEQMRTSRPSLRELDAEIAGELEAVLGGFSEKDILAEEKKPAKQEPQQPGTDTRRKKGKVMSVHGPDVFVDVPGGRGQGVMSLMQFPDGPPKPGDAVEFEIDGYDGANGLLLLSRRGAAVHADWDSVAEGMVVEARVTETNKGGLAVDVNGIRGFMPISQIDLYRVEKPEEYVNQKLRCVVSEVNKEERNLVVSRRTLLEKEREEAREKLWAELAEGQVREGIVRNVREFGAFVDLGGVDGLIPISEMSWQRVNDPNTLVQTGLKVKVVVVRLDREARKVGLSLKQLLPSPWDNMQDHFHVGQVVAGKVTKLMEFGAFVEIAPGLEGLIHISELAPFRVRRISDFVKPEQEVQVKILNIDNQARKISLSLKAAQPKEEDAAEAVEEEPEVPVEPPKPRTTPLRGGIGQQWSLPEKPE
jgi:small subunit ribosomal protein S1